MASHLIFDLDGTLSDPAVGIGRSFNYALTAFGHAPVPDGAISRLIGPPLDQGFQSVLGDATPAHLAELVAKFRERYGTLGYAENTLYAGIPEALQKLAAASIRLGVCTSKRADFAERILAMFGLRALFDFIDGGDVGISKAQQLGALRASGAIPATSIMIGDRAVDIEAARANGLGAVGVLWGHGSEQELRAAKPDRLLTAPAELTDLATLLR